MRTGYVKARKLNSIMPFGEFGGLTDDDLKAMFAYVRTLKPVKHRVDNSLAANLLQALPTQTRWRRPKLTPKESVILSGVAASRSEAATQSKDPYELIGSRPGLLFQAMAISSAPSATLWLLLPYAMGYILSPLCGNEDRGVNFQIPKYLSDSVWRGDPRPHAGAVDKLALRPCSFPLE